MKVAVAVSSSKVVSSPANPLLKDVRRSVAQGTLTADGLWVAENFHLLEEALRSDLEVPTVLASTKVQGAVERHVGKLKSVRLTVVAEPLFRRIAGTESTQGVISLVRPPAWRLQDVLRRSPLVVALDGLQDPGNAGAIVRSAEAFGATGVIFLAGTASPFNAKTLRASAGSLFRVPFVFGIDSKIVRASFRQRKIQRVAATPRAKLRLDHYDWNGPTALMIGSEAHGVSETFLQGVQRIRVPTTGVESLNAAAAAAVILYEAARQRARADLGETTRRSR